MSEYIKWKGRVLCTLSSIIISQFSTFISKFVRSFFCQPTIRKNINNTTIHFQPDYQTFKRFFSFVVALLMTF